ncbi:MAG TPA: biopolymer transporter ExbD [Anaeromyxobacter sp.]|nr:biopolymer transporter ExbD [Anaeromyxobacter sp.]
MRRHIRAEEETGELNIVPYLDVVVNLVMFMLLSMTGLITLGVLNVSAPKIGGEGAGAQAAGDQPKLLLTVAIGAQGFYVAGAGGVLGKDAASNDQARPPTVPRRPDGKYDYAALTAELQKIKEKYPSETQVILSADPDVLYDTLIQTMDACRESVVRRPDGSSERKPLFYDVSLSLIG